jgi:hypothetical protein
MLETFEHGVAPEKFCPPMLTQARHFHVLQAAIWTASTAYASAAVVMQALRANIAAPVVAANSIATLVAPAAASNYLSIKSYS